MRRGARTALYLISVYALVVAAILGLRHSFLYPFDTHPSEPEGIPGAEIVMLPRDGGDPPLPVWLSPGRPSQPIVLYFMGNVGNLRHFTPRLAALAEAGFGVAAMTYRGGGGTWGTAREETIAADALVLNRWVRARYPGRAVAIYGTSLGTGVALGLASVAAPERLILEAPFTSMCQLAARHVPGIPFCWLLWDEQYPSAERIATLDAPVLVLHGDADAVIPVEMGRKMAALAPRGSLVEYPGGRHNTLISHGMLPDVVQFLRGSGQAN